VRRSGWRKRDEQDITQSFKKNWGGREVWPSVSPMALLCACYYSIETNHTIAAIIDEAVPVKDKFKIQQRAAFRLFVCILQ